MTLEHKKIQIMGPETIRNQQKPVYAKMNQCFKKAYPDIIPILHCDGAVAPLLNDIHEMGFEVFSPVQPDVSGHQPKDLKDNYGHLFPFWGAIDQQALFPNGTVEELEKDIIEKISILDKVECYMISPAHIIQNDVPPEQVLKFIELCEKLGKYE